MEKNFKNREILYENFLKKLFCIMRLTLFILTTSALSLFASGSYSQNAKVSLDLKSVTVKNALDAIENLSEFFFIYNNELINVERKIDLNVKDQKISDILSAIFDGAGVEVSVIDRKIVLAPTFMGEQQNGKKVAGKVTDSSGGSIPGVSVVVKGTTIGVITDNNGNYSLSNIPEKATLQFSFVGTKSQEVIVGGKTTLNVTLIEETIGINEVVAIGYGTSKKRDLTGATSSISATQLEKIPISTLGQGLQGRSAGVQVTNNDGSPGSAVSVKIRGTGTFGDNSPLYVVDGYPISGDLSQINTNDIASMDILKDASATAIYGSRASNGVVIITTKRGKNQDLQISVEAQSSVQSRPQYYSVMNASQFALAAQEVNKSSGYPLEPEWNNPGSLRNIDWQDALYRTGLTQNYNVSLRGGNEKVQTSFSVGYLDQKGIVLYSDFKRFNSSLALDYVPVKWLKLSTNMKYARSERIVRFGSGIGQIGILTRAVPTMTGNPVTDQIKDANGNYGYYSKTAKGTYTGTNLIADLEDQDVKNPTNNFMSTCALEINFLKGLKFKSNVGANVINNSGYNFTKSSDRTNPPIIATYSQKANDTFEWLWENTLAYNGTFGIHSIDFVGGISSQENTYRQMVVTGTGQTSNDLRNLGSLTTTVPSGNQQTWSLASQFGRLSYKIADKYIFTGTVRHDGSSRFGPGKKWGVFPSLAAAWNISDESFMKGIKFLNSLKLRGSWGKAGNQNIGLFQYQSNYTTGTSVVDNRGYVFGTTKAYQNGISLNNLPNANLTWESSIQSNVGLDASFLNGHINFTADYYNRESSNFLLNVPVPAQTGFSMATRNVGSIRNRGLELFLEYKESEKKFKWSVSGNLTTVNNKILSFTEGVTAITNSDNSLGFQAFGASLWTVYSQSVVGGNIGAFYGFKTNGIFQTQAEVDAANAGTRAKFGANTYYQLSATSPGDRRFVDTNGDGRVTDADRVVIGSPIPKMYGGLNFDGAFKQFDFSVFVYFCYGNDLFNYQRRNLETFDKSYGVGLQNMGTEYYNNYWKADRPSTIYPRLLSYDTPGNNRPSDAFVEDGSYIRLRNLQIGYTLPSAIANKIHCAKVRFFLSGQNLFTITKYTGLDPEVGDQGGVTGSGIDVGSFPSSRSYSLGLNLGF